MKVKVVTSNSTALLQYLNSVGSNLAKPAGKDTYILEGEAVTLEVVQHLTSESLVKEVKIL